MEDLNWFTALLPAAIGGAVLGLLQSWKVGRRGAVRVTLWALFGAIAGAVAFMAIFMIRML